MGGGVHFPKQKNIHTHIYIYIFIYIFIFQVHVCIYIYIYIHVDRICTQLYCLYIHIIHICIYIYIHVVLWHSLGHFKENESLAQQNRQLRQGARPISLDLQGRGSSANSGFEGSHVLKTDSGIDDPVSKGRSPNHE